MRYIYKKQLWLTGFVIMLALLGTADAAHAMSISPTVLDLTSAGSKNAGQITVVNDSSKPLPVEIVLSTVDVSEDGTFTTARIPADEFLIIPPQAMVAPGTTQAFRIQWVGDPQLKKSKSYIVSVNQVPVKFAAGASGMQVVVSFACVVNVAPLQGTASIEVLKTAVVMDDKGRARPQVTVRNPGNVHAKLVDATVELKGGGWSQTFTPEQLKQMLGVGLIQPGKTRRLMLRADLPAHVREITAAIQYKQP